MTLKGRKSPLKKLFKDSQMSSSARRQRKLRNTMVKKVSRREKEDCKDCIPIERQGEGEIRSLSFGCSSCFVHDKQLHDGV